MEEYPPKGMRTWVEVSNSALRSNYDTFRRLIGKNCRLMAVAKSNAYGHDFLQFSKEMERLGADFIGVDSMTEAVRLRKEGLKSRLLVLGYTLPSWYRQAQSLNISLTVSSLASLGTLVGNPDLEDNSKLKIHLKFDTGMHRQGFPPQEAAQAIREAQQIPNLEIEGIYTHFANAGNPTRPEGTQQQFKQFQEVCRLVEAAGLKPIKHAANTAATLLFPETHLDMVRIGIGLYGLWPSQEMLSHGAQNIELQPALSWKAIISEVKEVAAGESVGYDFTEALARDSKLAVIPIGYWHGFRRNLSSVARALVHGKSAKIVGLVSMDMVVIDVTDIPGVAMGDIATIIGQDGAEEITAFEMAELSQTSHYETVTCLNPKMKKLYL
jgi:alanine racemase